MAKKSTVSSRPAKLISKTSEDIANKKWTKNELAVFDRIAARQRAGDDSGIDYSDIPKLTDERLAKMVRFRDRKKIPVTSSTQR